MQIIDENEADHYQAEVVFRESPMTHLGWPLALLGGGVALFIFIAIDRVDPVFSWIAAFCIVFFLFTLYAVAPVLRKSNWLMKRTKDGLLIKFRSYLNAHLPPTGPNTIFIRNEEIAGVRTVREQRINHIPPDRRQINRYVHIDIVLNHLDTPALEEALRAERTMDGPLTYVQRGKVHAYPVRVPEPGVIRIAWKGHDTHIAPPAAQVLRMLGEDYPILEEQEFRNDYANRERHEELEAMLWEYCRRGKAMQAVQIARERYGYTIGEATMYVEEVMQEVRAEKKRQSS